MTRMLVIGLVTFLSVTNAHAQILGVGNESCGAWTRARKQQGSGQIEGRIISAGFISWIQGYLSAQFQTNSSIRRLTKGEFPQNAVILPDGRRELLPPTPPSVVVARDAYCEAHLNDPLCLIFDPDAPAVRLLDLGAIEGWIDNFCQDNPLSVLSAAVRRLFIEHARATGVTSLAAY